MKPEELKSRMRGVVCALMTPFTEDYRVDLEALNENARYQVESGIHVLLAAGSGGEFSSLSPEEFRDVVATVVVASSGRVPVLAGASHSGTHECIKLCKIAEDAGADGLLVVPPYYLRPTNEGLLRHYEMVAQSVGIGVAVYNHPGFSKINIPPRLCLTLVERIPQVVSVKESSGELSHFGEILRLVGDRVPVLMGKEATAFFGLACGSPGYVSSLSNLAPELCVALFQAFEKGELEEARKVHHRIAPFNELQAGALPGYPAMIPLIKEGMEMMGRRGGRVRPPLTSIDDAGKKELKKILKGWGLL